MVNLTGTALGLIFLIGSFGVLFGAALGYFLRKKIAKIQAGTLENELNRKIEQSKTQAKEILITAKEESVRIFEEAKKQEKEREEKLMKLEERLAHREDLLDKKMDSNEKTEKELALKAEKIKAIREEVERIKSEQVAALEKISGYNKDQAKEELFHSTEKLYADEILAKIKKLEKDGMQEMENKANALLATVIQRCASSAVSEVTTTTVNIPSDEMKGKIIGKEGRNIRTLERLTGVEIIVDDTPGTIIISCFDPLRRQVCKLALDKLMSDGRIQPARIEEAVEKAKEEITKKVKEAGEAAVQEAGLVGVDPRLATLLGRLHYRTSFGQNVLLHSLEAAHISAMLAEELGADVQVAKMGALFHDIGKAVDHEVQGTHVEIGRKILEKFGFNKKVIQAMQSHHEEYPYETLESIIVQVAEGISASRPGARRGTLETYIKRLEELEAIATSFDGVEKAYALSAGREVRIFVTPEKIDDLEARKLARAIADRIEQELKFPGEIKVNVIRETRTLEYAR